MSEMTKGIRNEGRVQRTCLKEEQSWYRRQLCHAVDVFKRRAELVQKTTLSCSGGV